MGGCMQLKLILLSASAWQTKNIFAECGKVPQKSYWPICGQPHASISYEYEWQFVVCGGYYKHVALAAAVAAAAPATTGKPCAGFCMGKGGMCNISGNKSCWQRATAMGKSNGTTCDARKRILRMNGHGVTYFCFCCYFCLCLLAFKKQFSML